MYKETIGIIGGFGAYATMNFHRRLLEEFASDHERNYPHIIMDNNYTMPSRTRALLYNESYEQIVCEITKSMKLLIQRGGATRIVLVCGTAHYFLKDVYKLFPEAEENVVDMINILGEELKRIGESQVLVIAAEGALKKELYVNRLKAYDVLVEQPKENEYGEIRYFIECVKQNKLSEETIKRFETFLDGYGIRNIVLGCTEFPVLVDYRRKIAADDKKKQSDYLFFDPLEMAIARLKKILV